MDHDDEYVGTGLMSRLANGSVGRTVGIVAAVAMLIPIGFFVLSLLTR